MFDEMQRLRQLKPLHNLLCHYQELCASDRQAWQDRLPELPGVEARDLVRLHGELLAYGWIEQNTGAGPTPRGDCVPACYRVTAAGLRALRQVREEQPAPA